VCDGVHQVALNELIFVADNVAYFSYQQLDEPLFVMNQIDIIVSTSGLHVLDMFSEVNDVTALTFVVIATKNTPQNITIIFR